MQQRLHNLYVIGEPGTRPVLAHDNINLDGLETGYLKNLELDDTTVNTALNFEDREVNLYVTQVYQHDSTHDANGFKAPAGSPLPGASWRYWFWNFHGSQMGWQSNLRHQMYIEGRLDSRLLINNIRITGSKQCSGVKSTRSFVTIRNSYLSGMLDEQNLDAGMRSDKVVDVASSARGRHLQQRPGRRVLQGTVGAFQRPGISARQARDVGRRFPCLSRTSASIRRGAPYAPDSRRRDSPPDLRPSSIRSSGGSFGRTTPPIRRIPTRSRSTSPTTGSAGSTRDDRRQSAFRDDGTAPREAAFQGSIAEIWGTVPQGWVERSVSFFANNRYEGWTAEDMADPRRWFDLNNHPDPSQVEKSGPGPWPYPPPPRAAVFVGGEQRPETQTAPIEMPDWFRI